MVSYAQREPHWVVHAIIIFFLNQQLKLLQEQKMQIQLGLHTSWHCKRQCTVQGGSASPHRYGVQLACSIQGIIKDWICEGLLQWYGMSQTSEHMHSLFLNLTRNHKSTWYEQIMTQRCQEYLVLSCTCFSSVIVPVESKMGDTLCSIPPTLNNIHHCMNTQRGKKAHPL